MCKLSNPGIKKIRRLRRNGMKIRLIAERFGVSTKTIAYWIYPKYRKARIEYSKKYFMPRYRTDKDFRKRVIKSVHKYLYNPLNKEKIKKQNRRYYLKHKMKYRLLYIKKSRNLACNSLDH